MESKQKPKGRVPRKVARWKVAARYPIPAVGFGRRLAVPNQIGHVPALAVRRTCKIPYFTLATISGGAGTAGAYVFSANGVYDPDITGAGHQTMAFDQMMTFYEHYTVTTCAVTLNAVNSSAANPITVGLMVSPDTTVLTDITQLNENGLLCKRMLAPFGSNNMATLHIEVDVAKVNGRKSIIGDDLYRGDSASNPTEQTYIHAFNYSSAGAAVSTTFEVYLEYTVTFTEPRKQPLS